jgi:hypothetical protein
MAENTPVKSTSFADVAEAVAKSLSLARTAGSSAFVTTAVAYPNGDAVIVRIDETAKGYAVGDDGYGAHTADLMGAASTFAKTVGQIATGWGLEYSQRSLFALAVPADRLTGAVVAVANASSQAVSRTVSSVAETKVKRSRLVFQERLREAFGKLIAFGAPVPGATRSWDVDGAVLSGGRPTAVFEFVAPAYSAVASAHMKLGDIRSLSDAPVTTAALADYEHTDASLRALLSNVTDFVIEAAGPVANYVRGTEKLPRYAPSAWLAGTQGLISRDE